MSAPFQNFACLFLICFSKFSFAANQDEILIKALKEQKQDIYLWEQQHSKLAPEAKLFALQLLSEEFSNNNFTTTHSEIERLSDRIIPGLFVYWASFCPSSRIQESHYQQWKHALAKARQQLCPNEELSHQMSCSHYPCCYNLESDLVLELSHQRLHTILALANKHAPLNIPESVAQDFLNHLGKCSSLNIYQQFFTQSFSKAAQSLQPCCLHICTHHTPDYRMSRYAMPGISWSYIQSLIQQAMSQSCSHQHFDSELCSSDCYERYK